MSSFLPMEHLKQLRHEHKETQQQLADLLQITVKSFREYESGSIPMRIDMLITLMEHYGVSADYILDRSDYRTTKSAAIGDLIPIDDASAKKLLSLPPSAVNNLARLLRSGETDRLLAYMCAYLDIGRAYTTDNKGKKVYIPGLGAKKGSNTIEPLEKLHFESLWSIAEVLNTIANNQRGEKKK